MNTFGRLRPIRDAEVEVVRTWRNAPAVRANMYTRHEISIEEHTAWWERTKARDDQQYFLYEQEGRPVGVVGFTSVDKTSENCSWAFYSAPNAPPGTGSRMEFLALEYVFLELKLNKLYCEVLAFNIPVLRLHEKFGFKVEGVFREQHRVEDKLVDIYRLALFAPDWKVRRDELYAKLSSR